MILILGVWTAILPSLGFPYSWKDILTVLTGLVFMCLGYLLYKDYKAMEDKEKIYDNFKENNNFDETGNNADDSVIETIDVPASEE